jgi:hypothetical protein
MMTTPRRARPLARSLAPGALLLLLACGGDSSSPTPPDGAPRTVVAMPVTGHGAVTARYTAEVWAHGSHAYTTTWGSRGSGFVPGNAIYVWDVRGPAPLLLDSVLVSGASTLGDVQVTDDGALMIVPTELSPGSIVVYDLSTPARPREISRFTSPKITNGVHTTEVQRVNGRLYAFLSINRSGSAPARLMVVDLGDPAAPKELWTRDMGQPFVHDVFVRDGLLFAALWADGVAIFDIGGGGKGGSIASPLELSRVATKNGSAHNVWWLHDPVTGSKKYIFVGEEAMGAAGFTSAKGDVHVVDISTLTAPHEVAFFNVAGAGAHNFSVDEERGILYAAFYNGGVQALDVRGELGSCSDSQKAADGRCDLRLMNRLMGIGLLNQGINVYVWGVQYVDGAVYASDMLNGLWKLAPVTR